MGDEQRAQFEVVFAEHFDDVLRFLLARCDAETAKDVAAETFLAAWRSVDRLPSEPKAWLLTVARRRVIDHYRAAGRREALVASLQVHHEYVSDPADHVTGHDQVRTAFEQLEARDQEVLRLLAWDGLSRAEAIQVLGCSAATFAVRLHRARRRLRAALDKQEPDERLELALWEVTS